MKAVAFILTLIVATATAFAPNASVRQSSPVRLQASKNQDDDFLNKISRQTTVTAASVMVALSTSPLIALADDEYEYGAVDAPIGIAWAGGLLAVLTALLPLALQGGEEAFEEMKNNDQDTWGK